MTESTGVIKATLTAFGEFLLRLHCSNTERFLQARSYEAWYAGAEANVCVLLSRLGINTNYITCVPANDVVSAGIDQLRSHGVGTEKILYKGERLGIYFTEPGNAIRPTRVIYDRTGSAYSYLSPGMFNWKSILKDSGYFHWSGIAAAVSQGAADVCVEALAEAEAQGIKISADFNYRTTLWKFGKDASEIMPSLLQYSHIAVADLDSASVYFGIETDRSLSFEERFRECAEALKQKLPKLEVLAMSFRKSQGGRMQYSGALMINDVYCYCMGYELGLITDQIGCGDAFTAGMLYGLLEDLAPQQIIDFATACGALKHSIKGDWAVLNEADIKQFMIIGATGRIVR